MRVSRVYTRRMHPTTYINPNSIETYKHTQFPVFVPFQFAYIVECVRRARLYIIITEVK